MFSVTNNYSSEPSTKYFKPNNKHDRYDRFQQRYTTDDIVSSKIMSKNTDLGTLYNSSLFNYINRKQKPLVEYGIHTRRPFPGNAHRYSKPVAPPHEPIPIKFPQKQYVFFGV